MWQLILLSYLKKDWEQSNVYIIVFKLWLYAFWTILTHCSTLNTFWDMTWGRNELRTRCYQCLLGRAMLIIVVWLFRWGQRNWWIPLYDPGFHSICTLENLPRGEYVVLPRRRLSGLASLAIQCQYLSAMYQSPQPGLQYIYLSFSLLPRYLD